MYVSDVCSVRPSPAAIKYDNRYVCNMGCSGVWCDGVMVHEIRIMKYETQNTREKKEEVLEEKGKKSNG
jgi:hypothetical protein